MKHTNERANNSQNNNRITEKIVIFSLALIVAGLLFYFFKDVFIPFIRLEIAQDLDGAKNFLIEKGFLGCVTVSVIEALQMVVIFIPAEFIQLSSGMSYPWWLAVILCDIGVILGASVIFFFVRVFKFKGDIFNKSAKLDKYDKKRAKTEKNIMILMYFLFFMPIIPFGAICYFASNKKIRYGKYILTCATGVIPSIFTSIIMGTAVKEFIANALPLWLLVIIIILAAAILFAFIYFILKRFYFKEYDKTPDSPAYSLVMKIVKIFLFGKCKIKLDEKDVKAVSAIEGPYLMLVSHGTAMDFYFASLLAPEKRFAMVMNRHIYNNKIIHKCAVKMGAIPKKLLVPDVGTIKGILKAKAAGYPIMMLPEGRMSSCGISNAINPAVVKLIKKLDIPVVLVKTKNAFLIKPKWRKRYMKNTVTVSVDRILDVNDIRSTSEDELYTIVKNGLFVDDFAERPPIFRQNGKAQGLENVLYACPRCGKLYTTRSKNNTLYCSACNAEYEIDKNYLFKSGEFQNLRDYYLYLAKKEEERLDTLDLLFKTNVKIFHTEDNGYDTDSGEFRLTKDKITYKSTAGGESFEILNRDLEGIAYSAGEEFEFYRNGRLYYFYPADNPQLCVRIALIFDIIKKQEKLKKEDIL